MLAAVGELGKATDALTPAPSATFNTETSFTVFDELHPIGAPLPADITTRQVAAPIRSLFRPSPR